MKMNTVGKLVVGAGIGVSSIAGVNAAKAQEVGQMSINDIKAAHARTLDSLKTVIKTTKAINEAKLDYKLDSLSYQKELNAAQKAYLREMNALLADTTGELSASTKVKITAEGGMLTATDMNSNVPLSGKYFGTTIDWNASKTLQPYARVQGNFGMTTPNTTAGQTVTQAIAGAKINLEPVNLDIAGFYADRPSPGVRGAGGVIGEAKVSVPQSSDSPIGFSMTAGGAGQYSKEGFFPVYRFDSKLQLALEDSQILSSIFGLPISAEVNYSPIHNINTLLKTNGLYAPLTTSTIGGKLKFNTLSGLVFSGDVEGGSSLFRMNAGVGTNSWQLNFNLEQYNNRDLNVRKVGVKGSVNIR